MLQAQLLQATGSIPNIPGISYGEINAILGVRENNQALKAKYKNCFRFQLYKTRNSTGIKIQLQSSYLPSYPLMGKKLYFALQRLEEKQKPNSSWSFL